MAKEKPADPEKEARKAAKAAKKEAKRSETNRVHKSKSDKKDKKEKKIAAEAAADTEVTTKLLNALEDTKPGSVVTKEKTGDLEIKVKSAPLLGALVPFANPLADEKVGKKVLKGVKKGVVESFSTIFTGKRKNQTDRSIATYKLQKTSPSNAVSRKSSNASANPNWPPQLVVELPPSSFWPPISLPWTSSRISLSSAKITGYRTCLCPRGRNWARPAARRGRLVWSW